MKRILGLTTAALMGASVLAAPAFAEQVDYLTDPAGGEAAAPDLNGDAADTDAGIDTGSTAAIGGDLDDALSAINASAANAAAIGAMGEVGTVNVVRIGALDSDVEAVEQAVGQNNAGVDELRDTIAGNPALHEQLQSEGVEMSSVVGAEVEAGGEITVYVQ